MSISGFDCRAWYSRQRPQCAVCREFGHRAPSCPLSGLCRRCRGPGHMARECRRAWGDLRPGKVLLSSTVPSADDDDDDANYVPPPDEVASVPSDGEVEMTSGDEEVAAQVVAPLPPRFSDKLYQYVDARVNIVLSSMSCDDVIKMSDDDINRLARCIIEEYVIGDPLGFDCAVSTLRFYRKWFENRVLREKEAR